MLTKSHDFFGTFAVYSFVAALVLHVVVAIWLQILVARINKYGRGLTRQFGKALPDIDYNDQRIPYELRNKFKILKLIWLAGVPIFLSPLVLYIIFGRSH